MTMTIDRSEQYKNLSHRVQNLNDFLTHYCTYVQLPQYAVMVSGPWGSGKTWKIRQFQKQLKAENKRCLYISLYGVNNIDGVIDQCYPQLHPVLGNAKVKQSLSLLRSLIKVTFKVNLDDIEINSADLSIPAITASTETVNAVIIFDDLERCSLPLEEVFGIINQFVEHDGNHVIVLANPQHLEATDAKIAFATMMEKVIGRSFRIVPDATDAISAFTAALNPLCRRIVEPHIAMISEIFRRAGYDNLRQLRQALLDFSSLWHCLPNAAHALKPDDRFWKRLLNDVVILSLEWRAEAISTVDLKEIERCSVDPKRRVEYHATNATHGVHRLEIHRMTDGTRWALPASAYMRFFEQGYLSPAYADQAFKCSSLSSVNKLPAWVRFWHWEQLADAEFSTLVESILADVRALRLSSREQLFQIAGTLLYLGNLGMLQEDNVLDIVKNVVDQLHGRRALPDAASRASSDLVGNEIDHVLPYWSENTREFSEFCLHYDNACKQVDATTLVHLIDKWLWEFETDVDLWASRIDGSTRRLPYPHPDPFAKLLINKGVPDLAKIVGVLSHRYLRADALFGDVRTDLIFFSQLPKSAQRYADIQDRTSTDESNARPTISRRYLITIVLPTFDEIADRLDQIQRT